MYCGKFLSKTSLKRIYTFFNTVLWIIIALFLPKIIIKILKKNEVDRKLELKNSKFSKLNRIELKTKHWKVIFVVKGTQSKIQLVFNLIV